MNSSTRRRLAAGTLTLAATAGFCFAGVSAASAIDGPVNTPPVAANDFYSVNAGETLTVSAPGFLANDFDPDDGDNLSTVVYFGFDPAETTVYEDGSFTITPDPSIPGDRSFTYRAYDGFAMSDWAAVTITVVPAPEPEPEPVVPLGTPDNYTTQAGVPLNVPASGVLSNDDTGAFPAVIDVKDLPEGLTPNYDGSFSYLPPAGFVGIVSYSYRMTADDTTASDWILVTITVTPFMPVVVVDEPDPVVPDPDPTTPDPTTPDPTTDPTTPEVPATPVTPVVAQPAVSVAAPAVTPASDSTVLASTGTVSGGLIAPVFALLALGVGLTLVGGRREKPTN